MLDRIDIHIEVPIVDHLKLTDSRLGEGSETIRARSTRAREIQHQRFAGNQTTSTNADMRPAEVRIHCKLDDASTNLVRTAMAQLQLSARAFHRF
jgi:magnesium chelatase family protein